MSRIEVTEKLPLLSKRDDNKNAMETGGEATFNETVVNMMKLCMGTGTLALPFAAQKGGLILNIFGLIGIAIWNIYSVQRLCAALQIYRKHGQSSQALPRVATSLFSKVGYLAFREFGIHGLDMCMAILFLGIIVSYEDAVIGFLEDTPFGTGSINVDAFIISIVIGSLSLVPNMGYLAKASAYGLFVLAFAFIVIAFNGSSSGGMPLESINLWPQDGLAGISHWFGCVVFGFGVVPLTFDYHESMKEPNRLAHATAVALSGVVVSYLVIAYGFLLLYPIVMGGDVIEDLLPTSGLVPTVVRVAMITVIILTAPLLVFPCGSILEGKIRLLLSRDNICSDRLLQVIVRLSVCIFCTIISISVPGFVYVLSFVGCCAVALVGFVIPPLLHITLTLKCEDTSSRWAGLFLDTVMLLWGVTAMIISSIYTFKKLREG